MPTKQVAVTVTTGDDATLDLTILPTTTGQQLLNDVATNVGIEEVWFFGLQYEAQKGYSAWLVPTEKVLDQIDSKKTALHFKLSVKFYPEDASEELIQDITKRYIFNETKERILSEKVLCSVEEAVTLAIYYCQAMFGDYKVGAYKPGELAGQVLPPSLLKEQNITNEDWEELIVPEWKTLTNSRKYRLREDAMLEYIKFAEGLEMYGVECIPIQNKKGTALLCCIDTFGVKVCKPNEVLTPSVGYVWSEITEMAVHGKKFVIKLNTGPKHVQYATSPQVNKDILHLCLGNRDLYFRRRAPVPVVIQQMKAKAREDREAKLMKMAQVESDDQAAVSSSTFEDILADDEEVRSLKQELQFHETQAIKIREELQRRKKERESRKKEARNSMMIETTKRLQSVHTTRKKDQTEVSEPSTDTMQVIAEAEPIAETNVTVLQNETSVKQAEEMATKTESTVENATPPKEDESLEQAEEVATKVDSSVENATPKKDEATEEQQADTEKGEDVKTTDLKRETEETLGEKEQSVKSSPSYEDSKASVEETDSPTAKPEAVSTAGNVSVKEKLKQITEMMKELREGTDSKQEITFTEEKEKEDRDRYKSWRHIRRAGNARARIEMFENM